MNTIDSDFGVTVAYTDDETILVVCGEADVASALAFRAAVGTVESAGDSVVLDLAAVSFMDSSGLHVIAEMLLRQQASNGSLRIRNPHRQLREVLRITGLASYVTVEETCESTTDPYDEHPSTSDREAGSDRALLAHLPAWRSSVRSAPNVLETVVP